ncbi:alcohol dehydrogenase catalytic domain-containing protein [Amycolatopsis sp. DSM 110486]|uniref:alcohol dehydrogenase catalytic domain-containing protein n=1 Tax=Amycolatopsis sp. DSM 110486 TaxID=2865832 RepID=UPI001C6A251E|nr:alcohol dehydrogenase catalytic domain-containing protein [Amycolatopsis sp. DSM 110486]QYN19318.1 alcohol dehydrogenase catalytic domain-containing protein [Amycolatopsis sp. DSM 110486]
MRAVILTSPGEPEVVELPDPHPADGQLRIRMAGAAVNPADLHVIDSGHTGVGLGLDVAGVVDEVGPGVTEFAVGDRVAALQFPHAPHAVAGAAAEYALVPAKDTAAVPDGVDLLDAATVPCNSLTAAQLLAHLGPAAGRRLLVTGAAGGVGGYVVALAAQDGWSVVALARASDTEFLTRAGAREIVTDLAQASEVDAVFDTALLNEAALAPVRANGSYVGIFPGREPAPERGIDVTSAVVFPDAAALTRMLALTEKGVLEARRAGTTPLAEAPAVYPKFRAGGLRGRLVLTP